MLFWGLLRWFWVCNDPRDSFQSLHCLDHHRLKSLSLFSNCTRSCRTSSLMYWNLPRGSLKRTVHSFESAITVGTAILNLPSNKNACLAEIKLYTQRIATEQEQKPKLTSEHNIRMQTWESSRCKSVSMRRDGQQLRFIQSVWWSSVERLRIRQKMPRWWYQAGTRGVGGFLTQLTLNQGVKGELPAVPFHGGDKPIGSFLNDKVKIFVTPSQHSKAKFREIFTDPKGTLTSGVKSKRSLASRNMNYWPQQLNFAF